MQPPTCNEDVPSFSAASARRCLLPREPYADALSASLTHRLSFLHRTHTLCGSLRKAPPLISSPTCSPDSASARIRVPVCSEGWAETKFRTGPIQNTEIMERTMFSGKRTRLSPRVPPLDSFRLSYYEPVAGHSQEQDSTGSGEGQEERVGRVENR